MSGKFIPIIYKYTFFHNCLSNKENLPEPAPTVSTKVCKPTSILILSNKFNKCEIEFFVTLQRYIVITAAKCRLF